MVPTEAECPHCAAIFRSRAEPPASTTHAEGEEAWVTCPHCHVRSRGDAWRAHAPDVHAVRPSPEPDDHGAAPPGRDGQWWLVLVVLLIAVGLAGGPRALYFSARQWLSGKSLLDQPAPAFAALRERLGATIRVSSIVISSDNVVFEVQDRSEPRRFDDYHYAAGSLTDPQPQESGDKPVLALDAVDTSAIARAVTDARARTSSASAEISTVVVAPREGGPRLLVSGESDREQWHFDYSKDGTFLNKK